MENLVEIYYVNVYNIGAIRHVCVLTIETLIGPAGDPTAVRRIHGND